MLEPGRVRLSDRIVLHQRSHPGWTISRVTRARFDRGLAEAEAQALANLGTLSPGWREVFRRKIDANFSDDDGRRLRGLA